MSREIGKTESKIIPWISNGLKAAFWSAVIVSPFVLFQEIKKEIARPVNHHNNEKPVIQNKQDSVRNYKLQ